MVLAQNHVHAHRVSAAAAPACFGPCEAPRVVPAALWRGCHSNRMAWRTAPCRYEPQCKEDLQEKGCFKLAGAMTQQTIGCACGLCGVLCHVRLQPTPVAGPCRCTCCRCHLQMKVLKLALAEELVSGLSPTGFAGGGVMGRRRPARPPNSRAPQLGEPERPGCTYFSACRNTRWTPCECGRPWGPSIKKC